jgi:hypothetical protein
MNIFQIESEIKELNKKQRNASDILDCVVNRHMYDFVVREKSYTVDRTPPVKTNINSVIADPRVKSVMEAVAREMSEQARNEIREFERKFDL